MTAKGGARLGMAFLLSGILCAVVVSKSAKAQA